MKVEFLPSRQVFNKIKLFLESEKVDQIDLAIAYLSKTGYSCIEEPFENFLQRKGHIRFLVGLSSFNITESSALKKMLKLSEKPDNKRLEIKYHRFKRKEFHPKIILFKFQNKLKAAIVGSSNLTSGGQKINVEANVCVEVHGKTQEEQQFESDTTSFFDFLWSPAKQITRSIINEYSKEENRERKKRTKTGNVPSTKLPNELFLNNRLIGANSFQVVCCECREEYIEIPLDQFCCENCGEDPLVDTPKPNSAEQKEKEKLQGINVKIDGVKSTVTKVALCCQNCSGKIDMTNDFTLWLTCEKCAQEREKNGETFCKPFSCWNQEKTRNIAYKLDPKKLIIKPENWDNKKLKPNSQKEERGQLLAHFPCEKRVLSPTEKKEIKNCIKRIGKKWDKHTSCIEIAKKYECSSWQIRAIKAWLNRE